MTRATALIPEVAGEPQTAMEIGEVAWGPEEKTSHDMYVFGGLHLRDGKDTAPEEVTPNAEI